MSVADTDGYNVRLLTARPGLGFLSGFKPSIPYVENEIWIDASAEKVWEAITDNANMSDGCLFSGQLLQHGKTDINGAGAMRELQGLGLKFTEEILTWQPLSQYSYRLTGGAPIKEHTGNVLLIPKSDGTTVRWTIQF